MPEIECVVDAQAVLGECPVWDAVAQALWWVDIEGRRIHRYDPTFQVDSSRELALRPGSIALSANFGRLLVAVENRLAWYDWDDEVLVDFVELEPEGTGNRMNDGRCDRSGRFWVGSMFADTSAGETTGRLHRVEPDGSFTTTQRGIGVANGLAFSPDGATMYFADSTRGTVWTYDYDGDTGEARNERVLVEFGELPGKPDGAAVDEAGCYWVACVYGWSVARITPEGSIDRVVELPVEKPTMPAFGGPQLDVLYVTTIGRGDSEPTVAHHPQDGGVFAIDVGVRGVREPVFSGTPPF